MTDLSQAALKPISLKNITITLLTTAIVGSVVAFAASGLLLTTSQAISVVGIGRYDQTTLVEDPQAVIERIKAPAFAAAASARAGISELSTLLPAGQYGGSGALSARSLRDPNLIEIRINLVQPEWAQKAINAVVEELIADHSAKMAPLVQNLELTLTALDRNASEIIKANDTISRRLSGSSQNEEIGHDDSVALLARALNEVGLGALVKTQSDIKVSLSSMHRSQVIAGPTVITPKAVLVYRMVAAGTVGGLLIGLLLLQMFPGFFRTGRPRLGISRPDPV
jgi:hypothetical protein